MESGPVVREFVVQALADLGFEATAASGPRAALRLLEQRSDFDLLLTDVVMPEMTGNALAEAATGRQPSLKVVFMTGYTQNAIVHNGVLDGGVHLVSKPFTLTDLERELNAALIAQPARS